MSGAMIKHVNTEDIGKMTDTEGLVFQDCGGDPQEWVDGINETLTHEEILQGCDVFKEIYVFEHEGHTNILFSMKDVSLDIGRLAMWRLRNHSAFGCIWLSDYLPNHLGINTDAVQTKPAKPEMRLAGMDGNIFGILGSASRLLKANGLGEQAKEMMERATAAGSYEQALHIVSEYVQTELSEPEQAPFSASTRDKTVCDQNTDRSAQGSTPAVKKTANKTTKPLSRGR